MFRIAVCDDEKTICAQIENIILNYREEAQENIAVDVYYSGEALCRRISQGESYDLLFLDIELTGMNGVETGNKIRNEMGNDTIQIIYISSKDSYCKELFDVRPMHFFSKPLDKGKIICAIRFAMELSENHGREFTYNKGHETYTKELKKIIYFERNKRSIRIVTTEGEESFCGKLDDVFREVSKHNFLYIHKSYIINYFYATKFTNDEVIMPNNKNLPISKKKRKEIREWQLQYEKGGL